MSSESDFFFGSSSSSDLSPSETSDAEQLVEEEEPAVEEPKEEDLKSLVSNLFPLIGESRPFKRIQEGLSKAHRYHFAIKSKRVSLETKLKARDEGLWPVPFRKRKYEDEPASDLEILLEKRLASLKNPSETATKILKKFDALLQHLKSSQTIGASQVLEAAKHVQISKSVVESATLELLELLPKMQPRSQQFHSQ